MSKRPEVRIALDKLLKDGQSRNEKKVFRDRRRRPILIEESVVDFDKLARSGRALKEVGRRVRVFDAGGLKEVASWIIPTEMTQIAREESETAAGIVLPLGTVMAQNGLWLQHRPGLEEIGTNDRGDLILREVAKPEAGRGAVRGAIVTPATGKPVRLIARRVAADFEADRREADGWGKLLAASEGRKSAKTSFKCGGIDFELHANAPRLTAAAGAMFPGGRDIEMVRIASLVAFRFKKLRRQPPRVVIHVIQGIPKDQAEWNAVMRKASPPKKAGSGFPMKLSESRFYDPSVRGIPGTAVVWLAEGREAGDEIKVLLLNTEDPGELRHRGVLAPLAGILALIDVIVSRTSTVVLNDKLTATAITGPTGAGKSLAALFWAGRNERFRRRELRRRYETDIRRTPDAGRLGETGIQKELDRILSRVGILCQENSVGLLKEGAGHWVFWACERAWYARTAGFPGLAFVLSENAPVLENARADYGGSGNTATLGAVEHSSPSERMIYDTAWGHVATDPASRKIGINLLLGRTIGDTILARKLTPREAVDWLLAGGDLEKGQEPLCNASLDLSRLLQQSGVVGPALRTAYDAARGGDTAALGGGDAALGSAIFDQLDVQVKLWLDFCRETPTWLVNGAWGMEITQDVIWVLSQMPEMLGDGKPVSVDAFKTAMHTRWGVAYGLHGEWTHSVAPEPHQEGRAIA